MGIRKFQIEVLNNPILSYFPGQPIQGHVRFITDTDCKTEGIKVKFTGKAIAEWLEDERTKSGKTHFVEEIIFSWQAYVLTHAKGNATEIIPAGEHFYPFEFNLPVGIPTSYSTPEVRVSYDIEAVLERSWKSNFKARIPFTVTGILDLNQLPDVGEAVGLRVSKNLYCCFCNSGSVGFEVKLARQGYVCGEYVELVIELFNQSSKEITNFSLCLIQKSLYRANMHSPATVHSKIICAERGPSVSPGDTEIWRGEILKIPTLPPSHLAASILKAVDIQYMLKMEMVLPGMNSNLIYEIPITIGTTPLRSIYKDLFPGLRFRRASYPSSTSSSSDMSALSRIQSSPLSHISEKFRLLSAAISETSLLEEEECSSLEPSVDLTEEFERLRQRRKSEGYEHAILPSSSS